MMINPMVPPDAVNTDPLASARRVVVISPHLDDAVLSIGATIARTVRSGAQVEVLTVFGYGPKSPAPAGPWDRKSGFATESAAAAARRREDEAACREIGATPVWLDFGAEPYERRGTPEQIRAAVASRVSGADCVLMPGFPLAHPDHAELTALLLRPPLGPRVGLYAEQPYVFYDRKSDRAGRPPTPAVIASLLPAPLAWTHHRVAKTERRAKVRAIRFYRSQIGQLGLSHIGLYRMLWHEARRGGEAIAWVPVGH